MRLKIKLLLMIIMINILLLKNLRSYQQKILLQDYQKQILTSKNYIANFLKKTDFDNELQKLNRNELNELIKKVKAISTKGSTKYLINKFSILNGLKYFYSGIFQNYLVFIPARKYIKNFSGTTWTDSWKSNGMSEGNIENITK